MRSFGIVEDKIKETDFFLSKLEESTRNQDVFWRKILFKCFYKCLAKYNFFIASCNEGYS